MMRIILFFFLTYAVETCCAQNKTDTPKMPKNSKELRQNLFKRYEFSIDSLNGNEKNVSNHYKKKKVYNNEMLNCFFSNEITSFASSAKDLSLENWFINIDSDSKNLTIGKSTDVVRSWNRLFHEDKDQNMKKLSNILTISFQAPVDKDSYSKLYSRNKKSNRYEFTNSVGLGLSYTYIGNGLIDFGKSEEKAKENIRQIKILRDSIVKLVINKEIDSYIKDQFIYDSLQVNIQFHNKEKRSESYKKLIHKKYYEYYKSITSKEIKYLKEEKLYNYYNVWWFTFGGYIPFTNKILKAIPSADDITYSDNAFSNWRTYASLTYFANMSSNTWIENIAAKIKVEIAYFNNNNFYAEDSSLKEIQTIVYESNTDPNEVLYGDKNYVYVGSYNEFRTVSLNFEGQIMILDNKLGVSGAFQKYFGHHNTENWKIGLPYSLKDKEGKPTVNFEINWREFNSEHYGGITATYVFGNFIK
jgi:hypothetical protein